MENFQNEADYLDALKERCVLPEGFSAAVCVFPLFPGNVPEGEKEMTLSLIRLGEPTGRFAGVFTRNRFPGAPVLLGKKRLEGETVRG